ncbi:hypothetical protein FA15DRAFT_673897 [Coprinopsis marcescibilis]|uniref:RRM domain-containing protein n=1 Tax=Coprinopsis marcescibilis TaxID=230819 RepID=A0A5C3KIC2_COPMA|nr:hypothetical protein FA15DRAFT_673897 [Coprinopsis marcescibilis]
MSYPVTVTGIAPSTSKSQLHDFFTFCGQIASIDYTEKSGKAIITFAKSSAAKTALMLNGGALEGSTLSVTSDAVHQDEHDTQAHDASTPLNQEDKPRAGIAAEILAKGYQLSDQVLAKAIELDKEKGISTKFLNYVHQLDKTVGERALGPDQTVSGKVQSTVESAQQQARAVDQQKGYLKTFHEYITKALASPLGQKVREFYTSTSKQILDIHEEARRLATEEQAKGGPGSTPVTASETSTKT